MKWNSLMPACSASRARLKSSARCSAIQSVTRRSLKPGSVEVSLCTASVSAVSEYASDDTLAAGGAPVICQEMDPSAW